MKPLEVCKPIIPSSLLWIGVLTSGVHVHWIVNKKNVVMVPHNLRNGLRGTLNSAELKRKVPVVSLARGLD